jgi:hypothetical protein
MMNLFSPNVDLSKVDNLVSGTLVTSKVWPVTITGTGIVKRGTLLTREAGETSYKKYENGDTIRAILLMDFNADDTDETEGVAAFGGEFNQNKIQEVMGITLDSEAILDAAEDKEIYIAPMNPAPETF